MAFEGTKAHSTTWVATAALSCQSAVREISDRVSKGDIIHHYAEYLDGRKNASAGFSHRCVCFIYDDKSAMAPGTGILKEVKKSQERKVYIYIGRKLRGPLF